MTDKNIPNVPFEHEDSDDKMSKDRKSTPEPQNQAQNQAQNPTNNRDPKRTQGLDEDHNTQEAPQALNPDGIESLDSFNEHKIDLSLETKDLDDDQILDLVLSKDEDELVPWEPVTLPSRGLFYGDQIPGGVVEVRPMNIYVEQIMSTQRFAKSGQSIDMVLKHCVRFPTPDFDPVDLLSGDGTFLLFYLRGITYGNLYEFIAQCTNEECRYKMTKTFDLNQLQDTINSPKPGNEEEPFECKLPYMSEMVGKPFNVGIRLIRRRDLLSMSNTRKINNLVKPAKVSDSKLNKKFRQVQSVQSINDFIEKNLNLIIVEAMGSRDRSKIKKLVSRLHSVDSTTIRERLEEVSPGIDTSIEIECSECGNQMTVNLPITESFFRRSRPGEDRE